MSSTLESKIQRIFKKYGVVLGYLFGSQKDLGKALLKGGRIPTPIEGADIDFAVLFKERPKNPLRTYALLSLDLQDLVRPYRADLLFLHEVDHLIQLEAIQGENIYCQSEKIREAYEDKVLMLAADEHEFFKRNEVDLSQAIGDGYFQFEYQNDKRPARVHKRIGPESKKAGLAR
jgi:hypothetical protein